MKRKRVAVDWPTFDAPLLRDIAAAFLRRRRAIAYRAGLTCQREFSESATGTFERLSLDTRAPRLHLNIWSDGLMRLTVCVRGLGRGARWAFKDTFHGDVHDVSAEALVSMVEATLSFRLGSEPAGDRQQLREVGARVRPRVE